MLSIFGKWQQSFGLIIIAFSAAFLKLPQINAAAIPTPFRKFPFEFIIGFRKTFWMWFLLLPTLYLCFKYNNNALALAGFAVILIVQIQFYNVQEALWYVWNEAKTPSEFLFHKIQTGLICMLISNALPTILLSIFLPDAAWAIIGTFLLSLILATFAVVNKYAWIPNQLPAIQGFLFVLNLFFPPLLIFSIPYLFRKAEANLKNILT